MKFLKEFFNRNEYNVRGFVLRYVKHENAWYVEKNNSILFIGDEESSKMYINTIAHSN